MKRLDYNDNVNESLDNGLARTRRGCARRKGSVEELQHRPAGCPMVLLRMIDDGEFAGWQRRFHRNHRKASARQVFLDREPGRHGNTETGHHRTLDGVWTIEGHRSRGSKPMTMAHRGVLATGI